MPLPRRSPQRRVPVGFSLARFDGHRAAMRALIVALLAVITATAVAPSPVLAAAARAAAPGDEIDEHTPEALANALAAAAQGYYDAQNALAASQQRQTEIEAKLREAESGLGELSAAVGNVASARYKGSQIGVLNGLFTGDGNPDTLLDAAAVAEYLVWRDDAHLRRYREALNEATRQRELLAAEIALQNKYVADRDNQKRNAEKALAEVGGLVSVGYTGPSHPAQPAPRNADGSWPRESCTVPEANTGVCVTPRTFHAVNEARLAGFLYNVFCFRNGSWGEHPQGRACDFYVRPDCFCEEAVQGEYRDYGNRLAAFFVENAEALGVFYVIWYRQIWMPGTGWRSYSGFGSASDEHTNHVHLSML